MADDLRPACLSCAARIDRLQTSFGVVCAYPCYCWMSMASARVLVAEVRERRRAAIASALAEVTSV